MNYLLETAQHQLSINDEFQSTLLEQMQLESEYIINCLESMAILIEAETNPEKKKNIFARMIEFIKNLFTKFTATAKKLVQSNADWMKENFPKLDKINYDGLEITMTPFWLADSSKMSSQITQLENKTKNLIRNSKNQSKKYKDKDEMVKGEYSNYLDSEDNLSGGLKNLYRVGNAKGAKPVAIRGNDLKSKLTGEFRKYCNNYQSGIVPTIKKAADNIEQELKRISTTLDKKATTESFCLVENSFFKDTELSFLEDFVLEAEGDSKAEDKKPSTQSSNTNDKNRPVTKVEVKDHGSEDNAKKQDVYNGMDSTELTFIKNVISVDQTNIAAFMTASEEKFHAYLNAAKQVLKARKIKEEKSETK